jgi:hypothetical protein
MTITDSQKIQGTFQAVDKKGNPTNPAGPLVVSVGDSNVLDSTVDDETHFTIIAKGPLGTGIPISVTDGVATAQDSIDVTGGAEASASISFGTPQEQ